jgi:DNA-binding response OmpR family regulator
MDISLLGCKNGLELTREIKKMSSFINTPILCITAHARSADRINAYDAGVDSYLAKPVNSDALFEKIRELIVV